MLKNLIVKSDGTEIDSSLILSCTLTQTLNSGQEFTIGSACTDEIEVEYLAQDDNLIAKGDVLTLYWVNDSGTKNKSRHILLRKTKLSGAYAGNIRHKHGL